jgi:ankyrin repeat protein
MTALHLMVDSHFDGESLNALLDKFPIDPEIRDNDGKTAMHYLHHYPDSCLEDTEIALSALRALLEHGANPDSLDDDGHTPLYYALGECQVDFVTELLDGGADPNWLDVDSKNYLHIAIEKGCRAAIRPLLEAGVAVNQQDGSGRTALDYAREKKEDLAMEDLLAAGE